MKPYPVAGQKAGPLAYRAAEVTDQLGKRVAARSQEVVADLRRATSDTEAPAEGTSSESAPADESAPSDQSGDSGESGGQF